MAHQRPTKSRNVTHADPQVPLNPSEEKSHAFAMEIRSVKRDGKKVDLTNFEIMEQKLFESGIAGNAYAQREYLRRADKVAAKKSKEIAAECARWTDFKEVQQRRLAQAKANGAPQARILPHPDDIIIDYERGVRFLGPVDEEEWQEFDGMVKVRHAMFVQQAMEDAVDGVPLRARPSMGAAMTAAILFDRMMPPSLQMSMSDRMFLAFDLRQLPARDVLRRCRAAWKAAGCDAPRGGRFGSKDRFVDMVDAIQHFRKVHRTDPENSDQIDYAAEAMTRAAYELAASANSTKATRKPRRMAGNTSQKPETRA